MTRVFLKAHCRFLSPLISCDSACGNERRVVITRAAIGAKLRLGIGFTSAFIGQAGPFYGPFGGRLLGPTDFEGRYGKTCAEASAGPPPLRIDNDFRDLDTPFRSRDRNAALGEGGPDLLVGSSYLFVSDKPSP